MSKILICISGSIAAIKLPELIHKLTEKGHSVKVIISRDGLNFVTPMAISSMGADVYLDENIDMSSHEQVMQHINLGKWADYILICPASANSIAKLSGGHSDNLLCATVLASTAKKIVVPAMNQLMWKNSLTQKNVETLKQHNFTFWGPVSGLQACGDNDIGRMIEVKEIIEKIDDLTHHPKGPFSGLHVVITAGGTKEMIDPVRYISNHSSGKMAYALAENAYAMGAHITLISASNLTVPEGITLFPVSGSKDMLDASLELAENCDIFIGAAAVCDYTVKTYAVEKIKKSDKINLELIPTADILKTLRTKFPKLFIVGFAAETNNIIEYAKEKLINKKLNLIVANDVSNNKVFHQDNNEVTIVNRDFVEFASGSASKDIIAKFILQHVNNEYFKS